MSRRLSITSWFTLATLLPLVLTGVTLIALAISATKRSSASLGRDILEESSRRVEEDVSRYLDHTRRMSDLLAGVIAESELNTTFWTSIRSRLFVLMRTTPEVGSICFTSESLDTVYLMRYAPELEFGRATGHPGGSTMRSYPARLDGKIAEKPEKVYEYDPRTRIWWQLGHSSDSPHWTAPYQWFQSTERLEESVLSIAYTRTVRDPSGNRMGVLSIDATLEQINEHLRRITRLPGAFIMVTDSRRQLIATSLDGVKSDLEPRQGLSQTLASTVRDASRLVDTLKGHDARFAEIDVGSTRYWVRQVPLSIERGPNWIMTLAIPDDQMLQSSKAALRWMTLAGSLCLSAAIVLGVLAARRMAHPLRELAAFAHSVGQGRFEERVNANATREVRQLSDALNTMAASLQERVQLLAQKDAAQDAAAMKSKLIAHVSHEFRTPLNAIMGYAEIIKEQCKSVSREVATADVDRILLASRHLLALINNLLDFSRVEAGRMPLSIVDFDIADLIRDVCDTVRPVVETHKNHFEVQAVAAGLRMTSDAVRVRQILINLLGNSAKFTHQGIISLKVELVGDRVVFTVRDNGAGMSPHQLGRLFEPFGQVDGKNRGSDVGAGLGLAISKQLCELLGGELVIESEIDRGTSAAVNLPRFHPASGQNEVR